MTGTITITFDENGTVLESDSSLTCAAMPTAAHVLALTTELKRVTRLMFDENHMRMVLSQSK